MPPRNEEIREIWIDRALKEKINVGAFSAAGDLAGHSFLASSDGGDTELAVFVHQGSRRRGIGTAMVRAVLQRAEQTGLRRMRATAAAENFPALRFLKRWGFRPSGFTYAATELHLELPTLVSKG